MSDLKGDVSGFLKSMDYLNLATVSREWRPLVHTVAYASDGAVAYFSTDRRSRKMEHISANPYVAYTVDSDSRDWAHMKGVQMQAKGSFVTDPLEQKKARDLMIAKFPMIANMPRDNNSVLVKLEPIECDYLDYSRGFGHSDRIKYV
jgi:nitroimidazol reductase NimA-like FMN-containing flavoprotein (pyridoxamine 5'-phosphate oxidase superfamily)